MTGVEDEIGSAKKRHERLRHREHPEPEGRHLFEPWGFRSHHIASAAKLWGTQHLLPPRSEIATDVR